jgi:hypothetical protein
LQSNLKKLAGLRADGDFPIVLEKKYGMGRSAVLDLWPPGGNAGRLSGAGFSAAFCSLLCTVEGSEVPFFLSKSPIGSGETRPRHYQL